ncbi:HDIG domain-containing protein [Patescibacteria group bacterium]|nr:HDIG domain-containing protein [Patescibacteria group bacterium]
MNISRSQALDLLHSKMQNQNLRRHCYSVEAVMRALAKHFDGNEDVWGIVGLLHDGDYEQTKEDMANHSVLMAKWVQDLGETDKDIVSGIKSHGASHRGEEPKNKMEWSLFCCDELTGLIVATTVVQPDKKLSGVTVEKVLDKFKTKSFAAGAKRENIVLCEEKLGIPLPQFVGIALRAMKEIAPEIGL